MRLNSKQKSALWLGTTILVAMGSYPPWQSGPGGAPADYALIFKPPQSLPGQPPMQIDFSRLLLQWAMVAFVTSSMVLTRHESGENKSNAAGEVPKNTGAALLTQPAVPLRSETEQLRRLPFPDDSLGELLVESQTNADYWDSVGEAQGLVTVPARSRLQLELRKDKHVSLGALGNPELGLVVSLDASESKIIDEDLIWVGALGSLEELDLTGTQITDAALSHLSRLTGLEKLWLDGTKVTDQGVSTLANLQSLKKVSFTNTGVSDSKIITLKQQSKDCQFVLSNGKNA
jgi:hypothetical protein